MEKKSTKVVKSASVKKSVKKKEPVKVGVKKTAPVGLAKVVSGQKKLSIANKAPERKEKEKEVGLVQKKKIQTGEGWRREMLRERAAKKK